MIVSGVNWRSQVIWLCQVLTEGDWWYDCVRCWLKVTGDMIVSGVDWRWLVIWLCQVSTEGDWWYDCVRCRLKITGDMIVSGVDWRWLVIWLCSGVDWRSQVIWSCHSRWESCRHCATTLGQLHSHCTSRTCHTLMRFSWTRSWYPSESHSSVVVLHCVSLKWKWNSACDFLTAKTKLQYLYDFLAFFDYQMLGSFIHISVNNARIWLEAAVTEVTCEVKWKELKVFFYVAWTVEHCQELKGSFM